MEFFSPSGLDSFLFQNLFRGKRNGVFLHVGSQAPNDHTRFFAQSLDWRGIDAPAGALNGILAQPGLPQIDLCLIDARASETAQLTEWDTSSCDVAALVIGNPDGNSVLRDGLRRRGYDFMGRLGEDDVYKQRSLPLIAQTTVFCAAWHGEPELTSQLRGHMENLDKQTAPIERVYVLDGNATAPEWLKGKVISVRESTTIYEAWNIALATVNTPFVMNLNLDDRLAPDAVAALQRALAKASAALVGGDWKVCFTQAENDAVVPVHRAEDLPWESTWPPQPGRLTRLGSGTGDRPTFGPGCMWRVETHVACPRFPWRFADYSKIHTSGDSIWWTILSNREQKMIRLPMVIGNYLSQPSRQAEFRHRGRSEHEIRQEIGAMII